MRVGVQDIPAHGFERKFRLEDAWAREAAAAATEGEPQALDGYMVLTLEGGIVTANVTFSARAERVCERCDEPTILEVAGDEQLRFAALIADAEAAEERELEAKELDLGWYVDGALLLEDVLAEAISLALPSRVVCSEPTACDARTEALLDQRGRAGQSDNPFAVLGTLRS